MRNLFIVLVLSGLVFLGYEYAYGPPAHAGDRVGKQLGSKQEEEGAGTQDPGKASLVAHENASAEAGVHVWKEALRSWDYAKLELAPSQREQLPEGSAARYALEVGLGMQQDSANHKELAAAADAYLSQASDEHREKANLLATAFGLLVSKGRLEAAVAALGARNEFLAGNASGAALAAFLAKLRSGQVEDEEACLMLSQLLDRMTRGEPVWGGREHFDKLAMVAERHQEILGRVFFNRAGSWRSQHYMVKGGDSLEKISNQYARNLRIPLARGFLAKINGIPNPDLLRRDIRLRIPTGRISGVVELSTHTIKIWVGDVLIRVYQVGLGKPENPTPVGTFTVLEKQVNPVWYPPDGSKPVDAGDERNPLGRYFLKFAHEVHRGYGIHGTEEQASVGKNMSLGCVRLRGDDMDDLFQILPRNAEVQVRR